MVADGKVRIYVEVTPKEAKQLENIAVVEFMTRTKLIHKVLNAYLIKYLSENRLDKND